MSDERVSPEVTEAERLREINRELVPVVVAKKFLSGEWLHIHGETAYDVDFAGNCYGCVTECTGIAASWCPIHGDCTCKRPEDGGGCPT